MSNRALATAVGLAAALTLCAPARATVFNVGPVSDTPYQQLVTYLTPDFPVGFQFEDFFNFNVPGPDGVVTNTQNFQLTFNFGSGPIDILDIDNLHMRLLNLGNADVLFDGAASNVVISLGSGDYRWVISGQTSGIGGGAYDFQIRTLPTPTTLALLVGAMGLIAAGCRRH